ncbi:MAG: hypothetical protein LBT59_15280, partial [Clostridiales bacterium]|nr:hypothetical protein [Clostridiales bacterium]
EEQGKNPFTLDSKDPSASYRQFIESEGRYTSLKISFPEKAGALFDTAEEDAKKRLATYKFKASEK